MKRIKIKSKVYYYCNTAEHYNINCRTFIDKIYIQYATSRFTL